MKAILNTVSRPILFAALGGLVALGGAQSLGWTGKTVIIEENNQRTAQVNWTSNRPMPAAPTDFVAAAERTVEAVVHVKTTAERVQNFIIHSMTCSLDAPLPLKNLEWKDRAQGLF